MSALELVALSQQAAKAALLARHLEMLLRDAPAGAPREACMQRYLQRAEQQRQHLHADLQAVHDEQRGRLGEVRDPEAGCPPLDDRSGVPFRHLA